MVGPVLRHEMMLGSRRSRAYLFRWLYAGWLVVQVGYFLFIWWSTNWMIAFTGGKPAYATTTVAEAFVGTFVVQQLILMALATPVLTAGAITEEKTRGTLQYLLTTDLQSWHIVVGKLLGRVFQVGLLALTGLPLFCFLGAFAGLEPSTLLAVVLITVLPLFALGSASLLASVWCRQTRDAVLGLYAVGILGFFLLYWGGLLNWFDPLYVLEPAWGAHSVYDLEEMLRRLGQTSLAWGGIAVVCLGLAVWRLRPAYVRQMQGAGRKRRLVLWPVRRAPVANNPVLWKERHVEGLAPVASLRRIPTWLVALAIFAGTTASSLAILVLFLPGFDLVQLAALCVRLRFAEAGQQLRSLTSGPAALSPAEAFYFQALVAMLLAGLVVGIRCSGAVSGERERRSWEALLLTPLSVRQMIRGKLWGIIGCSYVYLLAYAVPALALSALGGLESVFWTALWLAVTWLAMYFIGATGIWCSVRSRSSWRSLLGTVGIGYLGGGAVYLLTTPVIAVLAFLLLLLLAAVDYFLQTQLFSTAMSGGPTYFIAFKVASCIVLALIFWVAAWLFLGDAQKWVADRERTRHWKDEPLRLAPRRRRSRPRFYR